ncbi:MAG: ABC transporter permease subunit [Candidatus Viridilinea halotolerans]|uniref:ABC transporter permease subunit n=1 Tax=Candidatus Viridilinea halotolerans TaxID=2491704 RepID=A0A426TRH9_9CHLR|nr:MAG: ABC transporter permease subunit [Candidatus Viridilinea halotolerans]
MQRLTGLLVVAIWWEVGARLVGSPVLPTLTATLGALGAEVASGRMLSALIASLWHLLLGLALAIGGGTLLAMLLHLLPWLRVAVMPVVEAIRPVPALALFPLVVVLFGLTSTAQVAVIAWTAWPVVVLTTLHALEATERELLDAAALDGAGRMVLLLTIRLPLAFPLLVTAWRIAVSSGWISLVAAELLGAPTGLGVSAVEAGQRFQFATVGAYIIAIGVSGWAVAWGVGRVGERG